MIKKIIPVGQTGAVLAGLDAAIKFNIPHDCWIPKGRKSEDGRLPDRYQLQKIPNSSYPGHGIISKKNRKLFEAWDKEDPVDYWECERSKRIESIQGNANPFVKNVCVEKGFW